MSASAGLNEVTLSPFKFTRTATSAEKLNQALSRVVTIEPCNYHDRVPQSGAVASNCRTSLSPDCFWRRGKKSCVSKYWGHPDFTSFDVPSLIVGPETESLSPTQLREWNWKITTVCLGTTVQAYSFVLLQLS